MSIEIVNIEFIDNKNPIVDSDTSSFILPFYKNEDYLDISESRERFIKSCEQMIRTDVRYSAYIAHLKSQGLSKCVMLSGIYDEVGDKLSKTIEMHHGPILTLYDYCDILIEYCLGKRIPITTYRISDMVMLEHLYGNVQVVFVSGTAHELAHVRQIFINYKQSIGNLPIFIDKYRKYISNYYIDKINKYLDKSRKYEAEDFGTFELSKALYKN